MLTNLKLLPSQQYKLWIKVPAGIRGRTTGWTDLHREHTPVLKQMSQCIKVHQTYHDNKNNVSMPWRQEFISIKNPSPIQLYDFSINAKYLFKEVTMNQVFWFNDLECAQYIYKLTYVQILFRLPIFMQFHNKWVVPQHGLSMKTI